MLLLLNRLATITYKQCFTTSFSSHKSRTYLLYPCTGITRQYIQKITTNPYRTHFPIKQKKCYTQCVTLSTTGIEGFEPPDAGIRIPCLTAWRYPNISFLLPSATMIIIYEVDSFCKLFFHFFS